MPRVEDPSFHIFLESAEENIGAPVAAVCHKKFLRSCDERWRQVDLSDFDPGNLFDGGMDVRETASENAQHFLHSVGKATAPTKSGLSGRMTYSRRRRVKAFGSRAIPHSRRVSDANALNQQHKSRSRYFKFSQNSIGFFVSAVF